MPTVEELTDPFAAAYTPPPVAGPGVCDVCHNAPYAGEARCLSCSRTTATVSHPIELLVPISLYEVGGQLHNVLASYKRSPDPRVRQIHGLQVAATLHRFIRDHGDHLRATAGTDWDLLTIVPSKQARNMPHPLERTIQLSALLSHAYEPLLDPWEPSEIIPGRQASDKGFRARRPLDGERVLLLDDTFTSGASLQSAASALALAGAEVAAGLVVGRVIRPDFTPAMQELWDTQRQTPFNFDVCCLERARI